MYSDEGSEQGLRGTFETYKAEGDALYKNGAYRKAIESYGTALELKPGDKECLVARSRCHLQLGDTDAALEDAESSLSEDAGFHKGLYQKAEALYNKGEFEMALVFYHRGHKVRPELQKFRLGIQKAQEAIDNSVGSPDKIKLTKAGDLSFFSELTETKLKTKAKPKPTAKPGGSQLPQKASPHAHVLKVPVKASPKTVKQLLGELYGDKVYMEMLLKETDPSSRTGREIHKLASYGVSYLESIAGFWQQQKPMYARKTEHKQQPPADTQSTDKDAANKYVLKELELMENEQLEGYFAESLKRAKACLKTIDSYDDGVIENKNEVVAILHGNIGVSYLEQDQAEKALEYHQMELDMAQQYNLPEAKSRALDNLGRVYAKRGEYQIAIDLWTQKLSLTKSALEKTWLCHEIGRSHLELGNYQKALDFGEQSVKAAEESKDSMWRLNAAVLVAQSHVKLDNLQEALDSFQVSYDLANVQGDEAAADAIKVALEEVNYRLVERLK